MVNHQAHMSSQDKQAFCIRAVVLLKCLKASGYFGENSKNNDKLSADELYIGELLFHFQTGIQYNLHAVYQVRVCLCRIACLFTICNGLEITKCMFTFVRIHEYD